MSGERREVVTPTFTPRIQPNTQRFIERAVEERQASVGGYRFPLGVSCNHMAENSTGSEIKAMRQQMIAEAARLGALIDALQIAQAALTDSLR